MKFDTTFAHIRRRFSLFEHLDLDAATQEIRGNIYFSGPNTYILAIAIIIASVGLNVNSIPVIIGAMLISPLMGPIIGFGLAMAINDFQLLREALKNLVVMIAISIAFSTLYFIVSPLRLEHPTELLARTNPTIYDVLIATFSGFAGIIETCRKNKGTVIAGVAIATALMPPLCTIGYGIATLDIHYAFGAIFLFFINSVFISMATWVGAKFIGFKPVREVDPILQRRNQLRLTALILVLLIPSIITAINMVRQNNFERNVDAFVSSYRALGNGQLYDYQCSHETSPSTVDLYFLVQEMDSASTEDLVRLAGLHHIERDQIIMHSHSDGVGISNKMVEDILRREEEIMVQKDSTIARLQRENDAFRQREAKFAEELTVIVEHLAQQSKTTKR